MKDYQIKLIITIVIIFIIAIIFRVWVLNSDLPDIWKWELLK